MEVNLTVFFDLDNVLENHDDDSLFWSLLDFDVDSLLDFEDDEGGVDDFDEYNSVCLID